MKRGAIIVVLAALIAVLGTLYLGGRAWSIAHVRTWTGRTDLGFVTCNHCHITSVAKLPWEKARARHPSPNGLAVSPDGTAIYIACGDIDEIVEANVHTMEVTRRQKVHGRPVALALNASGAILFTACKDSDEVVAISTQSFTPIASAHVGSAPVALAACATAAGERLVVANSVSDDISVLAIESEITSTEPPGNGPALRLREIARPQGGREPYAVAIARDGAVAFIANRLATTESVLSVPSSELTLVDPARGRVLTRTELASAHLAEGTGIDHQHGWSLTPIVKVRNLVPITQVAGGWVMSSGVAVADRNGSIVQLPTDEPHAYFADPSGIAVDSVGRRAYIASGGSDAVTVIDLSNMAAWINSADAQLKADAINNLALSADYVIARIPCARNPRHLALNSDGSLLFVSEQLADSVQVIDTRTLATRGRIVLGDGGLTDPVRRGERVFTSAQHAFLHQFSCRSCHPDGHVDGLAYDFDGDGIGDNLLDNRSLLGLAGTAPFKWNGKNASLEIQCGPRFARVLMRTEPIPPSDLEDLVAFVEAQAPPRWHRKHNQPLTPQQARGKKLFFATTLPDGSPIPRDRRCHTCHRPPLFTNRLPSDVGSRGPRDSTNMFDTPHLLGIAHTAPYLHDGRARTLEELWTVYQTNDMHGVSSYMNKHQLNDLVEYLKTL